MNKFYRFYSISMPRIKNAYCLLGGHSICEGKSFGALTEAHLLIYGDEGSDSHRFSVRYTYPLGAVSSDFHGTTGYLEHEESLIHNLRQWAESKIDGFVSAELANHPNAIPEQDWRDSGHRGIYQAWISGLSTNHYSEIARITELDELRDLLASTEGVPQVKIDSL